MGIVGREMWALLSITVEPTITIPTMPIQWPFLQASCKLKGGVIIYDRGEAMQIESRVHSKCATPHAHSSYFHGIVNDSKGIFKSVLENNSNQGLLKQLS